MSEELMEETICLQKKLIETEIQLSKLHADIYTYREEIRKLRLSLPDVRTTKPSDMEKLRKKKQKLEQALEKLHNKINKKYKQLPHEKNNDNRVFYTVFMIILLGILLFLFGQSRKHANVN